MGEYGEEEGIGEGTDGMGTDGMPMPSISEDEGDFYQSFPESTAGEGEGEGGRGREGKRALKSIHGDYVQVATNHAVITMLLKAGDTAVLFADRVVKVSEELRVKRRLLVLSETSLYLLQPDTFQSKRRVALQKVDSLRLSELNDNFFAVVVNGEYDMLLASTRKTEIVTVLMEATKKLGAELNVSFSNIFEFSSRLDSRKELRFEAVDGCIRTTIKHVEEEAGGDKQTS